MWKGLLEIRTKGRVLFVRWQKGGRVSLLKWKEREGLNANRPFLPFPPSQNKGGAPARRRRPDSGALGLGGGREQGGRGREVLWWGSRPHLGLGWRAEAGRCEPAAAGGNGCGGGIVG